MKKDEFEIVEVVSIERSTFYLVRKAGKMGLLTSKYQVRIPVEWDELKINSHFKNKDFVHIPAFYSFYNQRNDPAVIVFGRKNGCWGVMDIWGKTIIPAVYETIEMVPFADLIFFKVISDGREGLICLNENILIPVKWEKILPADLSTSSPCPPFLWTRRANYLFCFESFNNLKNGCKRLALPEEQGFRFVIYNRYFELVTPVAVDGYASIESIYRFKQSTEYLLRKENRYGVLSIDPMPDKTFDQAMELIRKKQKIDYIDSIIAYIKESCKKINRYFEELKKAEKCEAHKAQNQKVGHQPSSRELITEVEIRKITIKLVDMLTDLKAIMLASWVGKMADLLTVEKQPEMLSIIGDLFEWLHALRANPALIYENKAVIAEETRQEVQPVYNRGFTEEAIYNEIKVKLKTDENKVGK